jgi:hypothetical protein
MFKVMLEVVPILLCTEVMPYSEVSPAEHVKQRYLAGTGVQQGFFKLDSIRKISLSIAGSRCS